MITYKQKGVSLIITVFIMIIILAVVLSISSLLYSEIKVIRNMGNSMVGFYAADSGIEKILYYDRHVKPTMTGGKTAVRGLCSMYVIDPVNNPNACKQDPNPSNSGIDHSIYCAPVTGFAPPVLGTTDPSHGCDPNVCDDCEVYFSTNFDGRTYYTSARVYPSGGSLSDVEIDSKGVFGSASREIQILTST